MAPDFEWQEGQHDLLFGNPRSNKFLCDTMFQGVALDPGFSTHEIHLDRATAHALVAIPAYVQEQISIVHAIEECLCLYLAVRVWKLCVFQQD
jgi:hypothetical protein